MGTIKYNGILFGGSNTSASNIFYDNTNTPLITSTMQGAIDDTISMIDVFKGAIDNEWINNSDVYSEIEKAITIHGKYSTFTLSFGTNNTNAPGDDWEWFCVTYKCSRIIAWNHEETCTNARNGTNTFTGWKRPLRAEDGLKFQFATDGEGNYGYLGADGSFTPFKTGDNGEAFRVAIIEALYFSDMDLTADSTWEEIINCLKTAYPSVFNILPQASTYFGNWSGSGSTSFSATQMVISTSTRSGTYGTSIYSTKQEIDLTKYKKLVIAGKDVGAVNGGDAANKCRIDIIGKEGTFTVYNRDTWIYNSTQTYTINVNYDITNLTGPYTVKIEFYYYISEDSCKATITDFRLEG